MKFVDEYNEKGHDVAITDHTDKQLALSINGDNYVILPNTGKRGLRTKRMVEKVFGPQIARAQSITQSAIKRMSPEDKEAFKKIQKEASASDSGLEKEDELTKQANELIDKYLEAEELAELGEKLAEKIDLDQLDALDVLLFRNVQSVSDGGLDNASNFDRHFSSPDRMDNIDILRDAVMEINNFLGGKRRKKPR